MSLLLHVCILGLVGIVSAADTNKSHTAISRQGIKPDADCGKEEKNCFQKCHYNGCEFRVTWKQIDNYVEFEVIQDTLSVFNLNVWIAIGFSENQEMKGTSVVMCLYNELSPSVELGYNPRHYFQKLHDTANILRKTSASFVDLIFTCKFQRRIKTELNHVASLSNPSYLLVGQGAVDLISGKPDRHNEIPACSNRKLNFIRGPDYPTTTSTPDITIKPAPFVPESKCGVTKGCFRSCDDTGQCSYQVTWEEAGDYIDFTMSRNINAVDNVWIALGISDDTNMKNTSVIMCKDTNDSISVELGYNPGYAYNTVATNTSDLVNTSGSLEDGIFTCRFQRRKIISDFNNTFSLTEKHFLIVANGTLVAGVPAKHTTAPIVSPEKQDFTHIVPESTTVNPGEITTQPGPITPDADCGVTKGCFSSCDSKDSCMFQVTWQEAGDYIDFTMSRNISAVDNVWIALGISDDTNMKNTSVIMCKDANGNISVELGYNPGYAYNTVATNTSDLVNTSGSLEDGIFTCRFQRRKIISDFNNTFSLTEKHFLIVANGTLVAGVPSKHTTAPIVSPEKEDFTHIVPEYTTVNPGEITTQPGPIVPDADCGVTKGCFSSCDSKDSCMFQVTWQEAGDYIDFTMSRNISAVDNVWIALGISDDTNMKNTSVIMCKDANGNISVELGYNPGYAYNTVATNTSDLVNTSGSLEDGIFTCRFQRKKIISDFNNTFSLNEKHFLIVANGTLVAGVPSKHTTAPIVSPEKEDFTHIVPEYTTVNPGEITTQSGPIVPDAECGVTKGCFSSCDSKDSCIFQVTWQEAGDYIDFTMSQTISGVDNVWIALGISDDTNMKNTSVIMCKDANGSISVELGYNPGYVYNTVATNTSDLVNTSGSLEDGIFTCRFQRRKIISDFNNTFSLTEKHFLIVANGTLVAGVPSKHTTAPIVSPQKQDFTHIVPEHTTVNPGEITTQPGPIVPDADCGVTKGCFSSCDSKDSCMFQVTWQEAGDYIDFTMSQNISAVDNVWIALGISDDTNMKNTSVIMCKESNGSISVELGYNPGYAYNTVATNTSDLIHTGGLHEDGVFKCSFQRRKTIEDFNNTFSLTEKRFLIIANGLLASGIPQKHTSEPVVSPDKEDFIHIVPDTTPVNPGEITTQSGTSIVKDPECGKTKGCFSDCKGQSCTYLVTWQSEPKTKTILFEIASAVTPSVDDWIAIALSPNGKMAKSSVMMCILKNGVVTTELGYNTDDPTYQPLTNKTEYLSDMSGSIEGSIMRCIFQRADRVSGTLNTDSMKIFDLDKQWYLLFAHGLAPSGVPERHKDKPTKSKGKIDFQKTADTGMGKQESALVKLHGFLMILAWIILSTSGMLIARYFKPILRKKVNGKHLWFQVHRTCMCTVVVLTLTALIIIFIEVGGFSKISVPDNIAYVKLHPLLGLIIVVLMLLNPMMAFFRCDHDHPYRPIFNWLHWGVAFVVQFLAGFNISFGFHLDKVNMPVDHALVVMYTFTATFIGTYIVYEVTKCILKRKKSNKPSEEIDQFSEDLNLVNDDETESPNYTSFKYIFGFHVISMLSYGITLMAFLLSG
ncbi:uncharacterized protein LOC117327508 [Pecten maximus]|uniref:uncharacterized protein LOC117327508 n=1 Tax=Pecten maximus TaxID=6579 RepID=UPI0014580486|nr:uncharacterized protein LOC117327508 [Pecten maximus]